jgi:hypothetical protein
MGAKERQHLTADDADLIKQQMANSNWQIRDPL